jgi:hypothetical protein
MPRYEKAIPHRGGASATATHALPAGRGKQPAVEKGNPWSAHRGRAGVRLVRRLERARRRGARVLRRQPAMAMSAAPSRPERSGASLTVMSSVRAASGIERPWTASRVPASSGAPACTTPPVITIRCGLELTRLARTAPIVHPALRTSSSAAPSPCAASWTELPGGRHRQPPALPCAPRYTDRRDDPAADAGADLHDQHVLGRPGDPPLTQGHDVDVVVGVDRAVVPAARAEERVVVPARHERRGDRPAGRELHRPRHAHPTAHTSAGVRPASTSTSWASRSTSASTGPGPSAMSIGCPTRHDLAPDLLAVIREHGGDVGRGRARRPLHLVTVGLGDRVCSEVAAGVAEGGDQGKTAMCVSFRLLLVITATGAR